MSTINLSLEGAQGVAQAIGQLSTAVETLSQRQAANTRATQAGARASRDAAGATQASAGAMQTFASAAQQSVQRVQSVASAIQGLVSQMGSRNHSAGLVASIAASTAQFAAMGAQLGPTGAVVGGVLGLTTALGGLISEQLSAADAARAHREELDGLVVAARAAREATNVSRSISEGGATLATAGLSDSDLATETEVRLRRLGEIERSFSTSFLSVGEMFDNAAERFRAYVNGEADPTSLDALSAERDRLRAEVENLDAESRRRSDEALVASNATIGATARAGAATPPSAPRRGGGGGGRSASSDTFDENAFLDSTYVLADAEAARREAERLAEAAAEANEALARARAADAEDFERWAEARADAEQRALDASRAAAAEHAALLAESTDAYAAFADSGRDSIEQIVEEWHAYNEAAKAAGVQTLSTSRLLSTSLTATGNRIADVVGGQMTGAFNQAVGAWLDGSKSFVEAAEEMAKGVIKALVQESIVQGVTELARGIADLASYRYDSAALHFAAAAAWAVVGGAAGAIGAATGAFGGGGQGAGANSSDGASPDRERQRDQQSGTMVVNIYADGMPTTRSDFAAGLARGIRDAQRAGYLPAGA